MMKISPYTEKFRHTVLVFNVEVLNQMPTLSAVTDKILSGFGLSNVFIEIARSIVFWWGGGWLSCVCSLVGLAHALQVTVND